MNPIRNAELPNPAPGTPAAELDAQPVLVTGATGFLGGRLVQRLLASGRRVTVLARRPVPELAARGARVVLGALDDPAALATACRGVATVFHVAAKVGVWGAYPDFYRVNVGGTQALLAACQATGVARFVHTSTPSVVYNGRDLAGADETLPLTHACPSPYPLTKALAERAVSEADAPGGLRTVALRPHLIWGEGDPHLVPRVLARARSGRLRIIGSGRNRVDLVHVDNAVDAHLLAEEALARGLAGGRAYFITNDEPVSLWGWINGLLTALGEPAVTRRVPLPLAWALGAACEGLWLLRPGGMGSAEPPLTRFIAAELAKDHWFSIAAAKRDLGYQPRITMAQGTAALVATLRRGSAQIRANP